MRCRLNKKIGLLFFCTLIISFLFCLSCSAQQLRYGSLSVDSNPQGARVFLDNQYKGNTPLNLKDLPVGQYSIKLVLNGFEEWNSSVAVLPILTVKLSTTLVPLPKSGYGSIAVNSSPQDAKVYLNNVHKGVTPINLREIPVGKYSILISLPGYEEWNSEVQVNASQTARIYAELTTQKNLGSLSIRSNPRGADIYLNENYEGLTPLDISEIPVGTHRVRISLPGYEEWIQEVSVSSSRMETVLAELKLIPRTGSIQIVCDQSGAKLFLNGTYQVTTSNYPVIIEEIDSGYYELIVIKDGFRGWIEEIDLLPGEERKIEVVMTKIIK